VRRRYKVATCNGWLSPRRGHDERVPGLTASVLDTWIAHREVARFRSEDALPRTLKREAKREHVLWLAQVRAAELEHLDGLLAGNGYGAGI
jgi:hypothetical protein